MSRLTWAKANPPAPEPLFELVPLPAADWELWAHMPKATVREAVALSLGTEPRPLALTSLQHETPKRYADHPAEFERRLTLAASHVDAAGPLHPLGYMPMLNGAECATVRLVEFRAWAEGLGWALPERFPQAAAVPMVPTAAEPVPGVPAAPAQGTEKKWTADRLAELSTYRSIHGTKAAAEHFGVTAARVRALLPTGKPATKGYSAFTHRLK